MAKVTIILEDTEDETGQPGMLVDVTVDPPAPQNEEDMTVAQVAGLDIMDMILGNSERVETEPEKMKKFKKIDDGLH